MSNFSKQKLALRYWLMGKGYIQALEALEFAARIHTGFRKDGVTPEFAHQVAICHYVRSLPPLMFPEETIIAVLLHDAREDYDVSDEEIINRFGTLVAGAVERLTKVFRGDKKPMDRYFAEIADCPIASIAKGGDRVHNLNSMIGVFAQAKQLEYAAEGEKHFLPMVKRARRRFPQQEPAYENIKHMLISQIELVRAIHSGI